MSTHMRDLVDAIARSLPAPVLDALSLHLDDHQMVQEAVIREAARKVLTDFLSDAGV